MKKNKCYNYITFLLSILVNVTINAQFSLVEDFDSFGGVGEWTINNGGGVQNYGGAENYLSFNLGSTPYLNSSTITATSPVYDLTTISGNATISFPISGIIENGWDYMYFDYFDRGAWVSDTVLTGLQTTNIVRTIIPNTSTQFRLRLVTDPPFIIWYRSNLISWRYNQGGPYQTPVDISNSYVGGNPRQVLVYYYDIPQFTIKGTIGTLPIELVSFNCDVVDNNILLSWLTATEINNDYFTIEHSIDGFNWYSLQTIQAAGNSNNTLEYSFMHYFPDSKINYYRLRQIDFDGNSEVFRAVVCSKEIEVEEVKEVIYYNVLGQIVDHNYKGIIIKQIK